MSANIELENVFSNPKLQCTLLNSSSFDATDESYIYVHCDCSLHTYTFTDQKSLKT